jgi:hypothetical protein
MPLHRIESMPLHNVDASLLHVAKLPYRIMSKLPYRIMSNLPYRIMSTLRCRISSSLPYGISSTLHWYFMAGGVMGLFVCGVRWCGVSDVVRGSGFWGFLRVDVSSAFYRYAAHTSFRQRHRVIAAHRASSMGYSSFPYTLPLRVWLCWYFLPISSLRLHLQAWLLTCELGPTNPMIPLMITI